jgi:hypothetical protein
MNGVLPLPRPACRQCAACRTTLALGRLGEPCAHAADTLIGDRRVDFEPGLLGLGALVGGGLFGGGYAGVKDDHNAELRNADQPGNPCRWASSNPCVTALTTSHVDSVGRT